MSTNVQAMTSGVNFGSPFSINSVQYRPVVGYEDSLSVGENGVVLSKDESLGIPIPMKIYKGSGKDIIKIGERGSYKSLLVEQLVADAFLGDQHPEIFAVEHVNGDVHDNRLENIRLSSESLRKAKKKVFKYSLDGKLLKSYENQLEATIDLGVSKSSINNFCMGRFKNDKDYILSFSDDFDETMKIHAMGTDDMDSIDFFDLVVGKKRNSLIRRTIHCKNIIYSTNKGASINRLSEGKQPTACPIKNYSEQNDGLIQQAICEVKGFQSSKKAVVNIDLTNNKQNVVIDLPNGYKMTIEKVGFAFENRLEVMLFSEYMITLLFEIYKKCKGKKITEILIEEVSNVKLN